MNIGNCPDEMKKPPVRVQPPAACESCEGSLRLAHADELAHPPAIVKLNHAGDLGEQRVVLAPAYILARLEPGAALPHDDGAAGNQLAAEHLHAEALRIGIAPVFGTA